MGYNVLTYDMRNHGRSGPAADGLLEWCDAAGAMIYVQKHDTLKNMTFGPFNRCAGGNTVMATINKRFELFEDVKASVCPQPCSVHIATKEPGGLQGIGDFMEKLDQGQLKLGGFKNAEMLPHHYAANVKILMHIVQFRDDFWRKPKDMQTNYDLLPAEGKKLLWIEGTVKCFDGYNYFGKHPKP